MVFARTRMMVRKVPLLRVLRRDDKATSVGPSGQRDDANDDANGMSSVQSPVVANNETRISTRCTGNASMEDSVATVTQDDVIEYIFDELDTQAVEVEPTGEAVDEIVPESANPQTEDATCQSHISIEISLDSPGDIDTFFSPRLIYPVLIVGALTILGLVISGVYLFSSIESRIHAPVIRLYNDHIHLGIRGLVGGNARIDYLSTGFFCLVFYGTLLWFAIMTHREVMGRHVVDSVAVDSATTTLANS
ncbi:hypothetical protein V1509DRAFT_7438 [Lipomyces kononenkoae]